MNARNIAKRQMARSIIRATACSWTTIWNAQQTIMRKHGKVCHINHRPISRWEIRS